MYPHAKNPAPEAQGAQADSIPPRLAEILKRQQLRQQIRAEEMAAKHRPAQGQLRPDWRAQ